MTRKELFLVAIHRSPYRSANAWARSQGITRTHLYAVLDGERDSATLTTKIDAFIRAHVPDAVIAA